MDSKSLTAALKEESRRLGFDLSGAAPANVPPADMDRLDRWLAEGFAGEMRFFADRRGAYNDLNQLLPGAKSVLMLGVNYRTVEPVMPGPGQARVARYAWGADYHEVIRGRLHRLADFHRRLVPGAGVRGVVDTAPLLERRFAQLAGLGSIGRNTMLINRRFGSWVLLAALLTTETLEYDEPCTEDLCGACRACLDACPNGALVEPGRLDARKCVSYLTIELRGDVPAELQNGCRGKLFGCDACQEACPWNRETPISEEQAFYPAAGMNPVELSEWIDMDESEFRRRRRHSSLRRAGSAGIRRNAQIALGDAKFGKKDC